MSAPFTVSSLPLIRTSPQRNATARCTPGTSRTRSATLGEKPANCGAVRMKSARTSLIAPRTDVLSESAKIATSATSASPTMSAAAVAEVRRGFRIALPRASEPVTPNTDGNGRPITLESGRAINGPKMTRPRKITKPPRNVTATALLTVRSAEKP